MTAKIESAGQAHPSGDGLQWSCRTMSLSLTFVILFYKMFSGTNERILQTNVSLRATMGTIREAIIPGEIFNKTELLYE